MEYAYMVCGYDSIYVQWYIYRYNDTNVQRASVLAMVYHYFPQFFIILLKQFCSTGRAGHFYYNNV